MEKASSVYDFALSKASERAEDADIVLSEGFYNKRFLNGTGVYYRVVGEIKTPEDKQYWLQQKQDCGEVVKRLKELSERWKNKQTVVRELHRKKKK